MYTLQVHPTGLGQFNNPNKPALYMSQNCWPTLSIDETDNKTSDPPPISQKFAMNDIFRSEAERRKTFEQWPLDYIDKNVLAQTGMFYTREHDKVKCYFCEVEIGRWEENDHPVGEHIRWSPNCPLMRRRTTNNIPLNMDELARILPPASYDVCGANEAIEVRGGAYPESSISSSASSSESPASPSSTYQMEYPEYAVEAARCRSFADWPRTMKQKPKQLAEAGFFYTGVGDRVNCFSCGGGLKDWDEKDEPWEQHAQWLNNCRYLKLMKGQTYIDAVQAKHKFGVEKALEAECAASDTEAQECGTQTEGQNKNSSAVAASPPAAATTTVATETTATAIGSDLLQRSDSNSSSTERKSIPEEKLCKICYSAEYNTAFLPCGHVVACAKCASSVTKCPMCRKPFRDVMRVYFS